MRQVGAVVIGTLFFAAVCHRGALADFRPRVDQSIHHADRTPKMPVKHKAPPNGWNIALDALRERRDITVQFTENELSAVLDHLRNDDEFCEMHLPVVAMIQQTIAARDHWVVMQLWGSRAFDSNPWLEVDSRATAS
jgi:hypothetical protein